MENPIRTKLLERIQLSVTKERFNSLPLKDKPRTYQDFIAQNKMVIDTMSPSWVVFHNAILHELGNKSAVYFRKTGALIIDTLHDEH